MLLVRMSTTIDAPIEDIFTTFHRPNGVFESMPKGRQVEALSPDETKMGVGIQFSKKIRKGFLPERTFKIECSSFEENRFVRFRRVNGPCQIDVLIALGSRQVVPSPSSPKVQRKQKEDGDTEEEEEEEEKEEEIDSNSDPSSASTFVVMESRAHNFLGWIETFFIREKMRRDFSVYLFNLKQYWEQQNQNVENTSTTSPKKNVEIRDEAPDVYKVFRL